MKVADRDAAAVRIPPPLVYVVGMFAGALLHRFVLALPIGLPRATRIGAATLLALAGIALVAGAFRLFRRTGQDAEPWKSTPQIISTGVYRFTRNPMYVCMALLQAAIGIGLANGWIVALIPAVLVGVYVTAIRHEETYLERKFGQVYLDYKASVRRWF